MTTSTAEVLTLQEAADRLKVHYMTAYRWVRRGELPAFKTGGRLRLRAQDVNRFLEARQVDVALPTANPGRTDWDTHVDRLTELLLAGEATESVGLVRKVVSDGAAAGDAYVRLLTPALHRVGDAWQHGEIGVGVEHRATGIATTIMARLSEHFRRRGPWMGVAITLTGPDERHGLAAAMVADFLRASGWDVHHLGADVPVDELVRFGRLVPADLLCVSVTMPLARQDYAALATAVEDAKVVFGGQAVDAGQAAAVGACAVEDLLGLRDAAEEASTTR